MISVLVRLSLVVVIVVNGFILTLPGVALAEKLSGNATDQINPYSPRFGHPYRRGVVPTRERHKLMRDWKSTHQLKNSNWEKSEPQEKAAIINASSTGTLSYQGGINNIGVSSGSQPKVYLIFWGSQWGNMSSSNGYAVFTGDTKGAAPYMQKWLRGLGTGGELWSGVMTQYCDGAIGVGSTSCPIGSSHVVYPSDGVLAGIWYDDNSAAPSQATGNQIALEAIKAAAQFGNTTALSNRTAQYVIMSPTGTNPDNWRNGGFCAWHDYNGDTSLSGGAASSPYGDIAFTNMPYVSDAGGSCGAGFLGSDPNLLQGFSIVGGHEYAETITDQNPAGGWINRASGEENADECSWIWSGQGAASLVTMATGSFAMQSTWSNDTNRCDISHPVISPSGGSPIADFSWVTSGATVTFTDQSTDAGGVLGNHLWNFGDGTMSTGQNPTHDYTASGQYNVTETVTDSTSGNVSSKSQSVSVTVVGPVSAGILTNGNYESLGGWNATAGVICTNSTCPGESAHSGNGFAWLDGYGTTHTDTLSQSYTISSAIKSAKLNFFLHIDTSETTKKYKYDTLTVTIKSGSNSAILAVYSNLNAASNYSLKSLTIPKSYLGRLLTLTFTGSEDTSLATSFVIDDVSVLTY